MKYERNIMEGKKVTYRFGYDLPIKHLATKIIVQYTNLQK